MERRKEGKKERRKEMKSKEMWVIYSVLHLSQSHTCQSGPQLNPLHTHEHQRETGSHSNFCPRPLLVSSEPSVHCMRVVAMESGQCSAGSRMLAWPCGAMCGPVRPCASRAARAAVSGRVQVCLAVSGRVRPRPVLSSPRLCPAVSGRVCPVWPAAAERSWLFPVHCVPTHREKNNPFSLYTKNIPN